VGKFFFAHRFFLFGLVGSKNTLPTLHNYITKYNGLGNQTDFYQG